MNPPDAKEMLRKIADDHGADHFGVCEIDDLRENFHFEIKKVSEKLPYAISIGAPVSTSVLKTLIDRPNYIYKAHYQQINHILNDVAYKITSTIQDWGHSALPIPASQIIKWKPMKAHLSHREIAHRSGLGWWGKNNLLVSPKHGAKIRLVTILTDLEMPVDSPLEYACGTCEACLKACPVGAIKETREEFDLKTCYKQVAEFGRPENIGSLICGLCLKVCYGPKGGRTDGTN